MGQGFSIGEVIDSHNFYSLIFEEELVRQAANAAKSVNRDFGFFHVIRISANCGAKISKSALKPMGYLA
jgi:hypothetical protein